MKSYSLDDRFAHILNYSLLGLILVCLFFTTRISYLLFHTLAELFSIVVAFSFFMIAWHSRQYIKNPYLLFIGIAYFFIGAIDLLHTLSYKGMPIFTDYDFYANQLWIGARYMESVTLLFGFYFLMTGKTFNPGRVFLGYTLLSILLILSVFYWKIFPECFVADRGQTQFKIYSEYVICTILALNIFLLHRNRHSFEEKIFHLLLWSVICTIISELAFTFYVSNYGLSNLVGHYFKIFSFFLVYQAIIKTGIEKPYELIFLDLDRVNKHLNDEIATRRKTEAEREKLIAKLQSALEKIQKLEGILPICMHCKKIRDDKGYWNEVEQYIHNHSDAKFSHGVCPHCLEEHYAHLKLRERKNKRCENLKYATDKIVQENNDS